MPAKSSTPAIPLRRGWSSHVKSAMLHVISLAQLTLTYTRGWAANSPNSRVRLKAEGDRAQQEVALLHEELRIHRAHMAQLPPHRRPYYPPTERFAILQLKAARNWSLEQTAQRFLVTTETIVSWLRRVDEQGPKALVQLAEPVNKFPDFLRAMVQRLKTLCPTLGKVKIAQILARVGLHLGVTTVGRILKEKPRHTTPAANPETSTEGHIVTAKYPGHVWHVDLTVVPTGGFWTSWLPFSLPQSWPFAWWVGVAEDHFSRRLMGATAFQSQPNCAAVCGFLARTIAKAKNTPRYIVCDRGQQFDCKGFRKWCKRKGIKRPRYGAIGKHGSIAVVERVILTIKSLLSCLLLVPYRREAFLRELTQVTEWYNAERPHSWLGRRTPDEAYHRRFPANRRPRFEPRSRWPRGSPCAKPWALVRGSPGAKLTLEVNFQAGRKHLPIVKLKRAG